jgi:phosphate transport system substrate-binding protein
MKHLYFFQLLLCITLGQLVPNGSVLAQTAIKIKGSDTMLPLSSTIVELFSASNPTPNVVVNGGGSGAGIHALMQQQADIAMSSRALKPEEKKSLEKQGDVVKEVVIGFDALSIIVHPSNKVTKLTQKQLAGIFSGLITNWKEVGGDDLKILVYTREASSGSYEFVREKLMGNLAFGPSAISLPATSAIVHSVSQNKAAIGYVGLAFVEEIVKPLAISVNGGQFVAPTFRNALNQTYPVSRPLYLYYLSKKSEAKLKGFLSFVLSSAGQKAVTHRGFIPVMAMRQGPAGVPETGLAATSAAH